MHSDRAQEDKHPHNAGTRAAALAVLILAGTGAAHAETLESIPGFTAAGGTQQSFARIVNHSAKPGTVRIEGVDDLGQRYGPVTLAMEAGQTRHFNSDDLERGNEGKGLARGLGTGIGNWRLALASDLRFEALAYMRTEDGFLTSIHDLAPATSEGPGHRYRIATFNPGSNRSQVSYLRLGNPGNETATVTITGIDDRGASPGTPVQIVLAPGASRTLSAQVLESGDGLDGALGDGEGKWALTVGSDQPVHAMSLLRSPTGHLTNLSAVPSGRNTLVPLFPSAGGHVQGFVRVINHSDEAGTVTVTASGENCPQRADWTIFFGTCPARIIARVSGSRMGAETPAGDRLGGWARSGSARMPTTGTGRAGSRSDLGRTR